MVENRDSDCPTVGYDLRGWLDWRTPCLQQCFVDRTSVDNVNSVVLPREGYRVLEPSNRRGTTAGNLNCNTQGGVANIKMPTSLLHPNRRKGRKPDTGYLNFIRDQPCVACYGVIGHVVHQRTKTEAAHVGQRGLGQTANDRETIPLCRFHHARNGGPKSHDRIGKNFWVTHNLNRVELIEHYNKLFLATRP